MATFHKPDLGRIQIYFGLAAICLGSLACPSVEPPPARPPAKATPPAAVQSAERPPVVQSFADEETEYAFTDPDRRKKIEALFPTIDALCEAEMRDEKLPGLVAGLVVDGDLVYGKGFGFADVEKKTKPDLDTVYRIASNTKSFTALSLLALRDEGAIALDDPITRLLPEASGLVYPTRDTPPLTVRQLLTHTSGLPRNGPFEDATFERPLTEEDITRSLSGLGVLIPPGTEFSYSNLGYRLLALAVARASHMSMPDFVKKRLLDPLGMTATTFDVEAVPKERLAPPYKGGSSGPFEIAEVQRFGAFVGAGGAYSSLRDMARYIAFQLDAYPSRNSPDTGPIRRSSVREAHSVAAKGGAIGTFVFDYGYGWFLVDSCDIGHLVTHSGAVEGYGAWWGFVPESGVGFIESTNVHRGGGLGRQVFRALKKAGALSTRVRRMKRLSPAFEAVMPKFLSVLNAWNEDVYKSMLPKRRGAPMDEEKKELAGYHAAHGTCKGYTPIEITSPYDARFAMQCERGSLEMAISLEPADGLIDAFNGTSRGVPPPTDLGAAADQLASLIGHWDERAYKKQIARTLKTPIAEAQATFNRLGAAHGVCKVSSFVRWATQPGFILGCERGGDLKLTLTLEEKSAAVASYAVTDLNPDACGGH